MISPLLDTKFNIQSVRTVAVCEVAKNVKGVTTASSKKGTPDAYLVVTNDDCVIVRYLLVYIKSRSNSSSNSVLLTLLSLLLLFIFYLAG